jgi:hypothetical protein
MTKAMKIEVRMEGGGEQREVVFRLRGLRGDTSEHDLQLLIMRDTPHYRCLSAGAWADEETWITPPVTANEGGDVEVRFDHHYATALESEGMLRVTARIAGSTSQEDVITGWGPEAGKESNVPQTSWPVRGMAVGVGMVLLAMGAGWYLFSLTSSDSNTLPASTAPVPTPVGLMDQREVARKIIEAQTDPGQAYEQAKQLYRERRFDAAFLVYRYAAQRGEGRASLAIGRMYDPSSFNADTSPFKKPNHDEAALWYAQAKRQTDPDTPEYLEAVKALQVLKRLESNG